MTKETDFRLFTSSSTLRHQKRGSLYRLDAPVYTLLPQTTHQDMGVPEIEAFLTHQAVEGNVSGSTQNQAFHALWHPYNSLSLMPACHCPARLASQPACQAERGGKGESVAGRAGEKGEGETSGLFTPTSILPCQVDKR